MKRLANTQKEPRTRTILRQVKRRNGQRGLPSGTFRHLMLMVSNK